MPLYFPVYVKFPAPRLSYISVLIDDGEDTVGAINSILRDDSLIVQPPTWCFERGCSLEGVGTVNLLHFIGLEEDFRRVLARLKERDLLFKRTGWEDGQKFTTDALPVTPKMTNDDLCIP